MRTEQLLWNSGEWLHQGGLQVHSPQLVLAFLSPGLPDIAETFDKLLDTYPGAHIVGCTTGGEILDHDVLDDSGVAIAIEFEKATIQLRSVSYESCTNSLEAGIRLAQQLRREELRGVIVLSDGVRVNGTHLVHGLREELGNAIPIVGGMAADRADFKRTLVGVDSQLAPNLVVAIGFYGNSLTINFGSNGGWTPFGPKRKITRAEGNILYELDGQPALDLYKRYLGEEATHLPGSALLFPLTVYEAGNEEHQLVRTIVGIDEEAKSMIFAGDVPEGDIAKLMMGHFDNLIDGAGTAAASIETPSGASFALLVSCIGRKLLLGQRAFEEVEEVSKKLGNIPQIGFYSYGEISPHHCSGLCQLHNQTMTVTVFSELTG